MDTDDTSTQPSRPIPSPQARAAHKKPQLPSEVPVSSSGNLDPATSHSSTKPDVKAKPKIAAKPKPPIASKPKSFSLRKSNLDGAETQLHVSKTRPLSIKVTDDSVHGKVANELANILSRPRSSSKGLLSPTDYSHSGVGSDPGTDTFNEVSPSSLSPVSPTNLVPKPRPRVTHSVVTGSLRSSASSKSPTENGSHDPAAFPPNSQMPNSLSMQQLNPPGQPLGVTPSLSDSALSSSTPSDGKAPTATEKSVRPALPVQPSKPPPRPPPPSRPPRPPTVSAATSVNPPTNQSSDRSRSLTSQPTDKNASQELKLDQTSQMPTHSLGAGGRSPTSSVKRKLEIQVLGARPMSEVGFREVKGQPQQQAQKPTNTTGAVSPGKLIQQTKTEIFQETRIKTSPDKPPSISPKQPEHTMTSPRDGYTDNIKVIPSARGNAGASSGPRKPTIIRPRRGPVPPTDHSDKDSLVSKSTSESAKPSPTIISPPGSDPSANTEISQTNTRPPAMQKREPPKSLAVKKDPWNQIAKGPGPLDNLAFSTGDTPPPRPHGLPPLPVILCRNDLKAVREGNTLIKFTGKPSSTFPKDVTSGAITENKPTKSIMDQSLENNFPVELEPISTTSPNPPSTSSPEGASEKPSDTADMFFLMSNVSKEHSPASDTAASANKPSALQRIYEYKKAREEKQPEKYKHRPDCYTDKPNNDAQFWKPSKNMPGNSPDSSQQKKSLSGAGGARCVAMYDFGGENDSELRFKEGDVIKLLERVDEEWYKGQLGGRQGSFPASYVDILVDLSQSEKAASSATNNEKKTKSDALQAFVAFDFEGAEACDLSLKAGQEVKVFAKVDSEWLYGEVGDKRGIFPALYVSVSEDDIADLPLHVSPQMQASAGNPSPKVSEEREVWGTALYEFTAENDSELSLAVGDRVKVTKSADDEWSTGEIGDRRGLFPTAFVQLNTGAS